MNKIIKNHQEIYIYFEVISARIVNRIYGKKNETILEEWFDQNRAWRIPEETIGEIPGGSSRKCCGKFPTTEFPNKRQRESLSKWSNI